MSPNAPTDAARDAAALAVDIAHPSAPPDVRSDLIEAVLAGEAP